MKPRQLSFLPKLMPHYRVDHGGDIGKGRRKGPRPFSQKNAIHVVFRSVKARGQWSLLTRRNESLVERLLKTCAKRYRIKVYRSENVGNHLHLLVKTEEKKYWLARDNFSGFLREFGGAVAFNITGAKKASPQGGFWEKRVYSRLVSWGREFDRIKEYFAKNFYEAKKLWTGAWDVDFQPVLASMCEAGVGPP